MDSIKRNRADKLTFNLRVRSVMEWILLGYITKDIIAQCNSKWGVDERMGYKYIKAAYKEFSEISKKDLEDKKALHLAARWKLYTELEGKKTPAGAQVALSILERIATIEGVVTNKIEHEVKVTKIKVTRK